MVFKHDVSSGRGLSVLRSRARTAIALLAIVGSASTAQAETLESARALFNRGQYFMAARTAFASMEGDATGTRGQAYALITRALIASKLYNSASYFFIRTLQTGDREAIRSVVPETEELMDVVGTDTLRKFLVEHTSTGDYRSDNLSALRFALGKESLLQGDTAKAVEHLVQVSERSALFPFTLLARGTARAIRGEIDAALRDFSRCASGGFHKRIDSKTESDLRARCEASKARVLYQKNRFLDADVAYDQIPKSSFVWTDILFEQAWNAFARGQYQRALGKLVTYNSPSLSFVYNSEVHVLRAQSYLALCLYPEANQAINDFTNRYSELGKKLKDMLESGLSLASFYEFGKRALAAKLHSDNDAYRVANRFVRSPYFQTLALGENRLERELRAIAYFDHEEQGTGTRRGLPGFLRQVLKWRKQVVSNLGGAFVKNGLLDYYQVLINDFEKTAFIKLEMLKRAKDRLQTDSVRSSRAAVEDSSVESSDRQMYWNFNGEFWLDELGDYVLDLTSRC